MSNAINRKLSDGREDLISHNSLKSFRTVKTVQSIRSMKSLRSIRSRLSGKSQKSRMSTRISKIEKSLDVIEEAEKGCLRARSVSPKMNRSTAMKNRSKKSSESQLLDLEIYNSESHFTTLNSCTSAKSKRSLKRSNSEFHTREKQILQELEENLLELE